MASTSSQKKGISFSIDSILNSTSPRETKQQPGTMYSPTSETIVTFPVITCSVSAGIPIMPLIVPEFSDLRTDDQLSECSEVSDKPNNSESPSLSLNDSSLLSQENSVDYTPQSSRGRRKKSRTAFTSEQIDGLEKRYSQQRYLSVSERSDLAVELDLSDQQVKTWFQNRRMKEKRQRRSAGTTAPPALPHLPSGGAVPGGSIMYHPDLTSQTMSMGFPAMSQNQVLASNLPYAELYSFPMGYYPVPLSQLRASY